MNGFEREYLNGTDGRSSVDRDQTSRAVNVDVPDVVSGVNDKKNVRTVRHILCETLLCDFLLLFAPSGDKTKAWMITWQKKKIKIILYTVIYVYKYRVLTRVNGSTQSSKLIAINQSSTDGITPRPIAQYVNLKYLTL